MAKAKPDARSGIIRFGAFEIDPQAGELRKQGLKIKLRDQAFQVLSMLLERPGQVVSREELQNKLWPADTFVDFDRGLNKAINHLRDALGDSAESPRFIETLPKRGYRFIAAAEESRVSSTPVTPVLTQPGAVVVTNIDNKVDDTRAATSVATQFLRRRGVLSTAFLWMMAGLLVGIGVIAATSLRRPSRPVDRPMMRFTDDLGPEAIRGKGPLGEILHPVISPDGTRLVFPVKGAGDTHRLATRLLDQPATVFLPGTEDAEDPFFSPDGQWIGFFAGGKMKKVAVQGGPVVTLCDSGTARGGSWGEDGNIIADLDRIHLFSVPSTGGRPQIVGKPEEHGEKGWIHPQILPGDDRVLFTGSVAISAAASDNANIEVLSLKSGQVKIVQRGGYFGRYVPSGHLLYIHAGTLYGVAFDLAHLETRGTPVPLVENLTDTAGSGRFDFSQTGTAVYFKEPRDLAPVSWIDSAGSIRPLLDTPAQAETPRLSPDGKQLALTVGGDLSVYDLERGAVRKLTNDAALNRRPIWTPDGKHVIFTSDNPSAEGEYFIWWSRADGSERPEKLFADKTPLQARSISPDGQRIAFLRTNDSNFTIWMLSLDLTDPDHAKPGKLEPFLREPVNQVDPVFSPDGRWIAYVSMTRNMPEVFVRRFPSFSSSLRWQVSTGRGKFPIWSRNSRELYYLDGDSHIMAVRYQTSDDVFTAEKPRQWSSMPLFRPLNNSLWNLDVAPDGQRFVALTLPAVSTTDAATVHMIVLLNFFDELHRRMPAR